ncbi:MAG: phosphoglucosamine mutase [Vicinamibacteria bacterium]|nr:phosphoglucosamine mutase [Vicinamibacteria bacterium]
MAPRLFGTDGVRGRAGRWPLDPVTVRRLGASIVRVLDSSAGPARLLIGRDTRESGAWIERELACGAQRAGATVVAAGVMPTPAVAYLTRTTDVTLGAVISASHNPFEDNGIKVFSGGGQKFTEELERRVEQDIADQTWSLESGDAPGLAATDLTGRYREHLREVLPDVGGLRGATFVVDCANGATTSVAPRVFADLGFDVDLIGASPDGRNINLGCGSTHPEAMAARVVERGAIAGVAFDGDGDRAILADEHGRLVDGDGVMLMCARQMKAEGRLRGNTVVATVMSNIGLELALAESGIALCRTQVGDKFVMEEIVREGYSLGGEQSGHVIFSDYLFTGDGLATALSVLRVMAITGRTLSSLGGELVTYPQVLVNVGVRERRDLSSVPSIADVMSRVESGLAGHGRLLVRYSGTEPLLRIMLEGRDRDEIAGWADEIAQVVKRELG